MCYDDNAIPPTPPGAGGFAHGEDIVLASAEGNRFAAYIAHPDSPTGAQILIYPDVRGLHKFYKELALRFAEVGKPTFTVGFCMGGSFSLMTGTQDFGLAGVIGFYAGLSRKFAGANATVLEEGAHIKYPVLGLFGGDDQNIPADQVHKLDEELDKAGVEHELVIYPGAPHSFFDRRATDFAEASSDAWRRVLAFISAHTPNK